MDGTVNIIQRNTLAKSEADLQRVLKSSNWTIIELFEAIAIKYRLFPIFHNIVNHSM